MFQCSSVYYANYTSTADIVINQGGTDSGKTYSILQVLFTIATTEKPPPQDAIITVVSESVPNLKKGAYRTAQNIIQGSPELQRFVLSEHSTDRLIYFKTGWVMEFNSYETEQQAKQGKRQYLFVNEANGIPYLIFWQLAKRTRKRAFIDYNPSAPFFAHEKLIGTEPEGNDLNARVQLIISDHRHNPFLSEKDHARTENIKDRNLWNVYARGRTGNLEGLIFPNWRQIPDSEYPWDNDFIGGLDFGYSVDPSVGMRVSKVANSIFLHELFYEPGLGPVKQKELFFANGFTESSIVYCDHDKEQIALLRRAGLRGAKEALKGNGSIKAGILLMNDYNVFYTASSKNLHEERVRYMWMKDKETGKNMNEPVGGYDHALDASRMPVYSHYPRSA